MVNAFRTVSENAALVLSSSMPNDLLVDEAQPEDHEVLSLLPAWRHVINAEGDRIMGTSKVDLLKESCSYEECNLGNFFTDAAIHALVNVTPFEQTFWTNASIALITSADLQISIEKGPITYSQLFSLAPFVVPLMALNLTGHQILAILEQSVENIDLSNGVNSTSTFFQVSGLKIKYDLSAPPGQRVKSVLARCAACRVPKYEALESSKIYRLVTSNYISKGGYGFNIFPESGTHAEECATDLQALINYVDSVKPILTGCEERITFL